MGVVYHCRTSSKLLCFPFPRFFCFFFPFLLGDKLFFLPYSILLLTFFLFLSSAYFCFCVCFLSFLLFFYFSFSSVSTHLFLLFFLLFFSFVLCVLVFCVLGLVPFSSYPLVCFPLSSHFLCRPSLLPSFPSCAVPGTPISQTFVVFFSCIFKSCLGLLLGFMCSSFLLLLLSFFVILAFLSFPVVLLDLNFLPSSVTPLYISSLFPYWLMSPLLRLLLFLILVSPFFHPLSSRQFRSNFIYPCLTPFFLSLIHVLISSPCLVCLLSLSFLLSPRSIIPNAAVMFLL